MEIFRNEVDLTTREALFTNFVRNVEVKKSYSQAASTEKTNEAKWQAFLSQPNPDAAHPIQNPNMAYMMKFDPFMFWFERSQLIRVPQEVSTEGTSEEPEVKKKMEKKFKNLIYALAKVDTIGAFWSIMNNLDKMVVFKMMDTYHIFRDGIDPAWEHPKNTNGGRFTFRVPKRYSQEVFHLFAAFCCGGEAERVAFRASDSLCGISFSARPVDDLLLIWNSNASSNTEEEAKTATLFQGEEKTDLFAWQMEIVDYVKKTCAAYPIQFVFYKKNASHNAFKS